MLTRHLSPSTSLRAVTSAAVAVLVLAGCSGDETGPEDDGGEAGQERSTATSPADLPEPPKVRDARGAVADVDYDECGTEPGEQPVQGTVRNRSGQARDYVITINWTNDTFDVLGRGIAVVRDVGGGETTDWELTAEVVEGATRCVPNVVRGEVADRDGG